MLKIYTAFTREVDDPEVAVAEILEQLNLGERQLKNTVGIVQFYHEAVDTGVYDAVAKALPFDLVGGVTIFNGTRDGHGDVAMSVTMLTGDDVTFAVKTIAGVQGRTREQIGEDVVRMGNEFLEIGEPKVVMSYLAFAPHYSGDDLILSLDKLRRPFPLFGTMVLINNEKPEQNYVVCGTEVSHDMSVFLAVYGNTDVKFRVTTAFAYDDSFIKHSEITDADKCVLKTVDGMTAVEYLRRSGFINPDNSPVSSTMWVIPAICTMPDGLKVGRAFLGLDAESGCVFTGGHVHTGSKVLFTTLSSEKTLASAAGLFKEIVDAGQNDVIVMSCIARLWALGMGFGGEADTIAEVVAEYEKSSGSKLNYSLSYSGGELCPVKNENGEYVNVYHGYTLIACIFN